MKVFEARAEDLRRLRASYGVIRLEAFGSVIGEHFDPQRSDLDFFVTFQPEPELAPAEQHFGLKDALEELFGRRVDLVERSAVDNPFFWPRQTSSADSSMPPSVNV